MTIRPARPGDRAAIWQVLEPVFRAGESYPMPRDITEAAAMAYWFSPGHEVFVAVEQASDADPGTVPAGDLAAASPILGTYYMKANQPGAGSHVANCGYVTAPSAGGRGIAGAMCLHSLDHARARGFEAMQFNFVVSSNDRAVRLWTRLGFDTVGRLPGAFRHPRLGLVDALVMFRSLV